MIRSLLGLPEDEEGNNEELNLEEGLDGQIILPL
jgi:hypothetical protein